MERDVQSPEAEPERVVELVSALLSGAGQPPTNLSAPLLYRLDEIAANHGGTVPLHGRLFAQWITMHSHESALIHTRREQQIRRPPTNG